MFVNEYSYIYTWTFLWRCERAWSCLNSDLGLGIDSLFTLFQTRASRQTQIVTHKCLLPREVQISEQHLFLSLWFILLLRRTGCRLHSIQIIQRIQMDLYWSLTCLSNTAQNSHMCALSVGKAISAHRGFTVILEFIKENVLSALFVIPGLPRLAPWEGIWLLSTASCLVLFVKH